VRDILGIIGEFALTRSEVLAPHTCLLRRVNRAKQHARDPRAAAAGRSGVGRRRRRLPILGRDPRDGKAARRRAPFSRRPFLSQRGRGLPLAARRRCGQPLRGAFRSRAPTPPPANSGERSQGWQSGKTSGPPPRAGLFFSQRGRSLPLAPRRRCGRPPRGSFKVARRRLPIFLAREPRAGNAARRRADFAPRLAFSFSRSRAACSRSRPGADFAAGGRRRVASK
jgi:hypothetical protein